MWGRLHPEETLIAALHMLPGTKHVVVVGCVGKLEERFETIAKEAFHNYGVKLEFTYFANLTMSDLLERLKHLPSHTIVYYTAITQDAAGARYRYGSVCTVGGLGRAGAGIRHGRFGSQGSNGMAETW